MPWCSIRSWVALVHGRVVGDVMPMKNAGELIAHCPGRFNGNNIDFASCQCERHFSCAGTDVCDTHWRPGLQAARLAGTDQCVDRCSRVSGADVPIRGRGTLERVDVVSFGNMGSRHSVSLLHG